MFQTQRNLAVKVMKHSFTGIDGETYDPARLLGAVAVIMFMVFQGYDLIWLKNKFDALNFGVGIGSLLGGYGASVMLKAKTEPAERETPR